jgi:steroid delta-isomerase-like uncharacterized protein
MAQSAVEVAQASIECFNVGDFDRLRALLADDSYEEELATQRRLEGADAQVEAARGWKEAFPDGRGTVHSAYVDGNTVTLELTWEGTLTGPMRTPDGQELPATGRRGTVKACEVMEIEDGRITATRHYFDLMTILQQVGAMEQSGAAA